MCYFIAVGANTKASAIAGLFEEEHDFDVGVLVPFPYMARAFPSDNLVRLVTRRGCSCDLVPVRSNRNRTLERAKASAIFRKAIAKGARDFGIIRIFVHRPTREPNAGTPPGARSSITSQGVLICDRWLVEDTLIEVSVNGFAAARSESSLR
jgi:hypothetical protein